MYTLRLGYASYEGPCVRSTEFLVTTEVRIVVTDFCASHTKWLGTPASIPRHTRSPALTSRISLIIHGHIASRHSFLRILHSFLTFNPSTCICQASSPFLLCRALWRFPGTLFPTSVPTLRARHYTLMAPTSLAILSTMVRVMVSFLLEANS